VTGSARSNRAECWHVAGLGRVVGVLRSSQLGIVAAVCVAVLVNLFGIRFDRRWDFTPDRRYTPTAALRAILRDLPGDVTVVVLLSRADPLAPTVEQLLSGYRLIAQRLVIDWIDPDRDPVRYLARQSELGLGAGHTDDGRVGSDAVLVVVGRGRRYAIEASELLDLDPKAGESTSHFEHTLAVALRTVFEPTSPTVCFTEGHRELSTSDHSPLGLSRLKERLEHDAATTRTANLGDSDERALMGCRLIVVAAPDVSLSPDALRRLTVAGQQSSLLLLGGVVPGTDGHLTTVGLERLAQLGGIVLGADVVIELDSAFRLPNLFGETFLSTPSEHPITRGLLRGHPTSPLRVVVSLAQSLTTQPGSEALPLLSSSPKSISLTDVSEQSVMRIEMASEGAKAQVVAMAGPILGGTDTQRRIAVAPPNIVQNRSFETPSLLVTQAFGLSLVSWLMSERASLVEFEPRPNRAADFELSAQELTDVTRYVVLVMPGCCLLAGLGVWLLRRKHQSHATEKPHGGQA
jgi:hypothetical protein